MHRGLRGLFGNYYGFVICFDDRFESGQQYDHDCSCCNYCCYVVIWMMDVGVAVLDAGFVVSESNRCRRSIQYGFEWTKRESCDLDTDFKESLRIRE